MSLSRIRTTGAIVMAGVLLTGTSLLGHGALGLPQASAEADQQQSGAGVNPDGKVSATAPSDSESPELGAIGKARIEVAGKLRDATQRLYQEGEVNIAEYLNTQKRYDEVVAEVTVRTAADRVGYLQRRLATYKKIEDATRELLRRGHATQRDALTAELARLDAEYALVKARADARSSSK
jgi:hypothetical protein